VLLHLIDATGDDPAEAWRIVQDELAAYGGGLDEKQQLVVLNKADLLDDELMADIAGQLIEAGAEHIHSISGATGAGVSELLDAVLPLLGEEPQREQIDTGDDEGEDDEDGGNRESEVKPWSPI
jgi:GTP-binding protein